MMSPTNFIQSWLNAVGSHNVEAVLAHYTRDAILIPTLGKRMLAGPELRSYFKMFLSKPKISGVLDTIVIQQGIDYVVCSGQYTFSYLEESCCRKGMTKVRVPARLSYVLAPTPNGGWLIRNHHSSKVP